ncbi:TPA: hypothetical protein N0F65_003000 [Lagenidium giganteum]|uniref:Myb/SANT-like DNA-binding domain-containing protein n=1 Tax=Lagenidium giganteum TaxID=4803 RepID=A0AAV2YL14_9STRA|nr:TPA: hypothetical protein N0F65_003000 [Lagenidium giganteum]
MRNVFEKELLDEIIDGPGRVDSSADTLEKKEFKQNQAEAKILIQSSLSSSLARQVMHHPTVTSMWQELCTMFDGERNAAVAALQNMSFPSASKGSKLRWTDEMVQVLLEVRVGTMSNQFRRNNSSAQLQELWRKVALKMNLMLDSSPPLEGLQIKNKFQALRAEYNAIKGEQEKTGNETNKSIVFPSYWDSLLQHFGSMSGLGQTDYGQLTIDVDMVCSPKASDSQKRVMSADDANDTKEECRRERVA